MCGKRAVGREQLTLPRKAVINEKRPWIPGSSHHSRRDRSPERNVAIGMSRTIAQLFLFKWCERKKKKKRNANSGGFEDNFNEEVTSD